MPLISNSLARDIAYGFGITISIFLAIRVASYQIHHPVEITDISEEPPKIPKEKRSGLDGELSLDVLEAMLRNPVYEIREAAIKILLRRFIDCPAAVKKLALMKEKGEAKIPDTASGEDAAFMIFTLGPALRERHNSEEVSFRDMLVGYPDVDSLAGLWEELVRSQDANVPAADNTEGQTAANGQPSQRNDEAANESIDDSGSDADENTTRRPRGNATLPSLFPQTDEHGLLPGFLDHLRNTQGITRIHTLDEVDEFNRTRNQTTVSGNNTPTTNSPSPSPSRDRQISHESNPPDSITNESQPRPRASPPPPPPSPRHNRTRRRSRAQLTLPSRRPTTPPPQTSQQDQPSPSRSNTPPSPPPFPPTVYQHHLSEILTSSGSRHYNLTLHTPSGAIVGAAERAEWERLHRAAWDAQWPPRRGGPALLAQRSEEAGVPLEWLFDGYESAGGAETEARRRARRRAAVVVEEPVGGEEEWWEEEEEGDVRADVRRGGRWVRDERGSEDGEEEEEEEDGEEEEEEEQEVSGEGFVEVTEEEEEEEEGEEERDEEAVEDNTDDFSAW